MEARVAGTGVARFSHKFSVINGGKVSPDAEERLRSQLKDIYKEADDENRNLAAGVLLSTYQRESRERWVLVLVCVLAAVATQAWAYCLFYH